MNDDPLTDDQVDLYPIHWPAHVADTLTNEPTDLWPTANPAQDRRADL